MLNINEYSLNNTLLMIYQIVAVIKHLEIYASMKNELQNNLDETECFIIQCSFSMTCINLLPYTFLLWWLKVPEALKTWFVLIIYITVKSLTFKPK